ncbi:MAG: GFA family protein [Methyloceanibacter sp.]|jgi:hypothetical protein
MTITGGCRCGAVRYRIEAETITTRHCWCRDCQFIGAGSGTVNVFFPSEAVKVEGALSDYTSHAASGNLMHRQFCPTCGTPVFTQSDARLHMIGVRAGTLDDPEIGKPQMTIWTSSAPSWAVFDPNIQRDEKQSPPTAGGEKLSR